MEYTIYDLMRGLQDGSVALPEDEAEIGRAHV